jgi:cell division protein FtsN
VQVVAANSQAAADAAVGKLRELGYDYRVVSEGGYFKVRAGGYGSRSDATAAVQRLRATFAGAFLVVDK